MSRAFTVDRQPPCMAQGEAGTGASAPQFVTWDGVADVPAAFTADIPKEAKTNAKHWKDRATPVALDHPSLEGKSREEQMTICFPVNSV